MIGPNRHRVKIDADLDQKRVEESLFLAVQYAYSGGVQGDVVEFGTMTGNSADALAQTIAIFDGEMKGRRSKVLHLFDSFEGMPESVADADISASQIAAGMWAPGTAIDLDETALRQRIEKVLPASQFVTYKGWFKHTVPLFQEHVSVIHVDCDLYQSTIDALDPLFAMASVDMGAIILFDDWNFNRASPKHGERAAWADLVTKHGIDAEDRGAYGAMGHAFIVRNYTPC